VPGGDYLTSSIQGYDRKRGRQHNMFTIAQIMNENGLENWQEWWCDALLFDAMIGNTDRHQDNWGIIRRGQVYEMAPLFDNGRSLGFELDLQRAEHLIHNDSKLEKYLMDGRHHVRRVLGEDRLNHSSMLKLLCCNKWGMGRHMLEKIQGFNLDSFMTMINELEYFFALRILEQVRLDVVKRLITARYIKLLNTIRVAE